MSINGASIDFSQAGDEETYQLWLRDPASAVAHLVEIDYHGTSAVYPNWVTYTLKSSDRSDLSFVGYPSRIKSIGSFSRQIGDRFTGIVGASIGEIEFDNMDGSLDLWHNLAVDGQKVRVLHGDPSWPYERFRIVYECISDRFTSSTWDSLKLQLRGIDYKYNLPIQTNLIGTTTANASSNLPIPKAFGQVFNIEPAQIDNVNLVYQWNDGAVTSVTDVRDGGIRFQTPQIAISAVSGNRISTATAHGFYAGTRVRCDIGGALPVSATWQAIAWNGSVFCVVGTGTVSAISSDGIAWTIHTLPLSTAWAGIAWNGAVFCAVGGATISAISTDGITWTQYNIPSTNYWEAIVWNGTVFCAVGNGSISATSPDGVTWTQHSMPVSGDWARIAWNGSIFCAIDYGSAVCATSPDGVTWTQHALPSSNNWYGIAWNGAVFCAVGDGPVAATSPDGVTWTARTTFGSAGWTNIAWNGTLFCAVAYGGTVVGTSPDGITWTQRTLPACPSYAWYGIAWNGTVFCAVAIGITVIFSYDGINWSNLANTLPTPLSTAMDYWVSPDGLTTTAFKLSATRGGAVVTLTNATTGAALIGYHWTADLTTGKLYLDSKTAGKLTMDGVAGSTDASNIVISALSAVNVSPSSQSRFKGKCPKTMGIYVNARRNRLDVADDVVNGIGAWYGYGREGMMLFGRVEGNPSSYDFALIEDDFTFNVLNIEKMIPPEKQHRLSFKKNYTNQSGALFAGVSADNRTLFSNDYSASSPMSSADVGANGGFHALAVIPDVQQTQLALAADAVAEATRLDAMYYGWGAIFAGTVGRIGTLIDIGNVVNVTHPRYGLSGGVSMTCVYANDNPTDDTVDLKFFVALADYAPGQL